MIARAFKTSALLSALFMLVYGSCNWLTAQRHDVGSFYFQWERYIPFVPLMIVPYMSIDLFFVAAPFLCRDQTDLRILSRRITTAILVAGACFLLVPLRFAFERPHVDGALGWVFNNFRSFDQPFNEFPSLHIALRTILAVFFVAHSKGVLRWAHRIWFNLIGFSTLLTYQHHVIDVMGGFVLGAMCIYLWQEQPLHRPVIRNLRVGSYYLTGAVIIAALAIVWQPIGLLLLWPAMSLALMSIAYFGLGAGVFRKSRGRLQPISWIMLWPVLLGQRVSLWYYARQCEPWNQLTDRVWIGRKLSDDEAQDALDQGVSAELDLAGEFSEARPFLTLNYLDSPVLDLTAPTQEQLSQAVDFIKRHSAEGRIVYVHCKAGYSRTAAVAGAYLLATGRAHSTAQAIAMLRRARPAILIRPEVLESLREYESSLKPKLSQPTQDAYELLGTIPFYFFR